MKKILSLAIVFMLCISTATAKEKDNYSIKFNGEVYKLLFSTKNKDFGGFLNEYYKPRETYNIWSEMVAIHHFPNAYSPIDQVKSFREYLGTMNCPSALTFDDKKNTAMIDFIMINDHQLPIVLEFNIFKYSKSKDCGSVALQYAKRYVVTTAFQMEGAKKDFENSRKKMLKKVQKFNIPDIVLKEIDKCKVEDINNEKEIIPVNNTQEIEEKIEETKTNLIEGTEKTTNESEFKEGDISEPDETPETTEKSTEQIIQEKTQTEDNAFDKNEIKNTKDNEIEEEESQEKSENKIQNKEEVSEPNQEIKAETDIENIENNNTKQVQEKIIEETNKDTSITEPEEIVEDVKKVDKTEETLQNEIVKPEEKNIKEINLKTDEIPEVKNAPIPREEEVTTKTLSKKEIKKAQKQQKKINKKNKKKTSAKKRAKEAAKKLAE